jgi:hypothetical protein
MLPFLNKSKDAAASGPVQHMNTTPELDEDDEDFDGLVPALEEFHTLMNAKRFKDAAECFRSCLDLVEKEPKKKKEEKKEDKKEEKKDKK